MLEKTVDLSDSATKVRFEFPDTETFSITEYYFTLKSLDTNRQITVKTTEKEYSEALYVNDQVSKGRLIFEAIYANYLLLGFFLMTLVLLAISLGLLIFPVHLKLKPEQIFIILALISGIAIAFISPAGQEPDGGDHILRAFDVSYGNITPILSRTFDENVQMPLNFSEFDDRVVQPERNQGLAHAEHLKNVYFSSGKSDFQNYKYNDNYSAMTYWPQGFGLYLGRVMNWNAFNTIELARILNLLIYILLTYLAIRKIPIFKNLMLVIALIPISIFQAGSLSADAVVNGFSFLFVALVINLSVQDKLINPLRLILPVLLLYITYLAKPAYIIMGLLILVIPFRKYPKLMTSILKYSSIVAVSAAFAAIIYGFASGNLMLAEGKAVYSTQLQFVLHNLYPTLQILIHTLDQNAFQYLTWLNMLGWINYSLSSLIIIVPLFIVLVGLADHNNYVHWNSWQKLMIWGSFLGSVAAIFVGLYIFDDVNDIAAPLMLGAQGRYFIPLLILPFLALERPIKFVKTHIIGSKIAGISGLLLVYTQYTLTRLIY